jgi:hypothetical protein
MYACAAVYVFTFLFNAQQEALGPANGGWTPKWQPELVVADVVPDKPMARAGVQKGDVLERVNGLPLRGMPDWFVARAHFRRDEPIELQIRRENQEMKRQLVIRDPAWRSWNRARLLVDIAFYSVRFLLLLLAIVIAFRHPREASSRLGALLLASGAVAEGYPSSGWAASLRQLPLPFAILVCLAVSFCLLGPALWLTFFATYPQRWFGRRSLRLLLLPVLAFAVSIMVSALAMVYAPGLLARDWPAALSAGPVRLIQDAFGVTPLLFLGVWPEQSTALQIAFLELWLVVSVAYFAAGVLLLLKASLRLQNPLERRRFGFLSASVTVFVLVVIHDVLVRNWTGWFGTVPPQLFSKASLEAEYVVFLLLPITMANCLLHSPKDLNTLAF